MSKSSYGGGRVRSLGPPMGLYGGVRERDPSSAGSEDDLLREAAAAHERLAAPLLPDGLEAQPPYGRTEVEDHVVALAAHRHDELALIANASSRQAARPCALSIELTEIEYEYLVSAANAEHERRERSGSLLSEALDALVTAVRTAMDDCPGESMSEVIYHAIDMATDCTDEALALYITENRSRFTVMAEEIAELQWIARMRERTT